MADFLTAYNKTGKNEGEYANDPKDRGGETWKGVARKFHPTWLGWSIIDAYRNVDGFPEILHTLPGLEVQVQKFYQQEFWNRIHGDAITNQDEANAIFDSSVNIGVPNAIKLAQRALSLPETGVMDTHTINKLNNKA